MSMFMGFDQPLLLRGFPQVLACECCSALTTGCSCPVDMGMSAEQQPARLRPADHPSVLARFYAKLDIRTDLMFEGTPCHLWNAGKSRGGDRWSEKAWYGTFNPGGVIKCGVRAHVFIAWVVGLIEAIRVPSDMNLDHRCTRSLCCNPLHLELVPAIVNQQRKYKR